MHISAVYLNLFDFVIFFLCIFGIDYNAALEYLNSTVKRHIKFDDYLINSRECSKTSLKQINKHN